MHRNIKARLPQAKPAKCSISGGYCNSDYSRVKPWYTLWCCTHIPRAIKLICPWFRAVSAGSRLSRFAGRTQRILQSYAEPLVLSCALGLWCRFMFCKIFQPLHFAFFNQPCYECLLLLRLMHRRYSDEVIDSLVQGLGLVIIMDLWPPM